MTTMQTMASPMVSYMSEGRRFLSHVTDETVNKGRKVAVPSLDESTLRTSLVLVDWENRFLPVQAPSVYPKTE
jgi:hypothetical protein